MMESMNTAALHTDVRTASADLHVVEQLTLLPTDSTPARFRLSRDTRERGLRHVAEIRQMLAERSTAAMASLDNVQTLPTRHESAA